MNMNIKILLADDHAIVRAGIRSIVERRKGIEVIGEASSGEEVLKMMFKIRPDIYILDVSMPGLNGIDTTERIMKEDEKAKVIILSMHDDRTFVEKAFKNGAKGYILKENAPEEIIKAIREVYDGNFYLSPKISSYLVNGFLFNNLSEDKKNDVLLTTREREVLQMVAEGKTSKEIATYTSISVHTVNVHRKNIMRKLGLHKQADLVRYAIKEGLVKL